MTGPGRPVLRAENARRRTSDTRSGLLSTSTDFVTDSYALTELHSGTTPSRSVEPPCGRTSTGVESEKAVATPERAFSAPGPAWLVKTPIGCPFEVRA